MKVVLGLGTNVGRRLENLRATLRVLRLESSDHGIRVLKVSPIYESDALLPNGAPPTWNLPYLNLALLCETDHAPMDLLAKIKGIEARIGRITSERWAPRLIDIDILMAEDVFFANERLKIPHAPLLERPFVLLPLSDLVPSWRIPHGFSGVENRGTYAVGCTVLELSHLWRRSPKDLVPFRTHRTTFTLTESVAALNITPDSFSDGGRYLDPEAALAQAKILLEQGADILDVGAESTCPWSKPTSQPEEWARLEPFLTRLAVEKKTSGTEFVLSVDTFRPPTVVQALELGANWINDQSGGDSDALLEAVAKSSADIVIMHHKELPENRSNPFPFEADPIALVLEWGYKRIETLVRAGISRNRIIFDPGISFGISPAQVWEIFQNLGALHALNTRLLVGHSRKSFLTSVTRLPSAERDLETSIISTHLAAHGIDYVRVHNIPYFKRALATWSHLDGISTYC